MPPIKTLPNTRTILVTGFRNPDEVARFTKMLPRKEVYETYNIPSINCVFVNFFDIRKSIQFNQMFRSATTRKDVYGLNDKIDFTHLTFTYTVSKREMQRGTEEVRPEQNQASVIIYFKDVDFDCQDSTVIKFLAKYGEIKDVRLSKPHQKIMEFYDFRATKKACAFLDNTDFGTGTIRIKCVWDIMINYKQDFIKRTDEILRPLMNTCPAGFNQTFNITPNGDLDAEIINTARHEAAVSVYNSVDTTGPTENIYSPPTDQGNTSANTSYSNNTMPSYGSESPAKRAKHTMSPQDETVEMIHSRDKVVSTEVVDVTPLMELFDKFIISRIDEVEDMFRRY